MKTSTISMTLPVDVAEEYRRWVKDCGASVGALPNAMRLQCLMDLFPAPEMAMLWWWRIVRFGYFESLSEPGHNWLLGMTTGHLAARCIHLLSLIPDDEPGTTEMKQEATEAFTIAKIVSARLASRRSTLEHVNRLYRQHLQDKRDGKSDGVCGWTGQYAALHKSGKLPAPLLPQYYQPQEGGAA